MNKRTSDSKSKPRPKTWRQKLLRVILWILGIIGGITLATMLFLFVRYVVININADQLQKQLTSDVAAIQPEAKQLADKEQREIIDLLIDKTTLVGQPVYSASYDGCYTDHNDSGWFAVSYNYRCALSYVNIIEVNMPDSLKQRITKKAEVPRQEEPAPWELYEHVSVNDLLDSSESPSQDQRTKLYEVRLLSPIPLESVDIKQIASSQHAMFSSAVTYAARDAHNNRALISETENGELNPDKDYLIATWDSRYFDQNIGCAWAKIVFCTSPLQPVGFR